MHKSGLEQVQPICSVLSTIISTVAAIALAPGNPKTFYLGYATGGVWKTTNHATTFAPVFDDAETSSIGSLAVCDEKIIWVGTGQGNGRNSSSWGNGVYRSTDGGGSFVHVGLPETHDISPLSQLTPAIVDQAFHLFEPLPATPRYRLSYGGLWSDRMFIASNPPMGAVISYWIRDYTDDEVTITIRARDANGAKGHLVRKLTASSRRGINRVVWDLQPPSRQRLENPDGLPDFVPAGLYTVTVALGEEELSATLDVLAAPDR